MKHELRSLSHALIVITVVALAACGGSASVGAGNGRSGHALTGEASWYGERFQGRSTASGEPFDMHDMTAAHRTFDFGTVVRVTRLDNRKSVVVRINDRGPYSGGRIIDLSRAAADEIDMLRDGTAEVRLEVLRAPR